MKRRILHAEARLTAERGCAPSSPSVRRAHSSSVSRFVASLAFFVSLLFFVDPRASEKENNQRATYLSYGRERENGFSRQWTEKRETLNVTQRERERVREKERAKASKKHDMERQG
jgi:hypothetical protein